MPPVGTLNYGNDAGGYFVELSGAEIPVAVGGDFGTCEIRIPVTAGTSTGTSQAYTFEIASGAVTGNRNGTPETNSGAPQQSITVQAINKPTVRQYLPDGSTLVLGGAAKRLRIRIENSNDIAIPNYTVTDTFPLLGGIPAFKVAPPPNAVLSCNNSGATPAFTPAAGDAALTMTGTIPPKVGNTNGRCEFTVDVVANTTGTQYQATVTNLIHRSNDFTNDIGIPFASNASRTLRMRSPFRLEAGFANPRLATGQSDKMTIVLRNDGGTALDMSSFSNDPIQGGAFANTGLTVNNIDSVACTVGGAPGNFAITGGGSGIAQTSNTTIPGNGSCTIIVDYTGFVQTAGEAQTYTNTISAADISIATQIGGQPVITEGASTSVEIGDNLRIYLTSTPGSVAPGNPIRYVVEVENFNATAIGPVDVTNTLPAGTTIMTGPVTINGQTNDYTPMLNGAGCSGLVDNSVTGSDTASYIFDSVPARDDVNTPRSCYITYWAISPAIPASVLNMINIGDVCYGSPAICNAESALFGTVAVAGQLTLTKSFTPATLSEGANTTVRLDATNTTANAITGLAIADLLPATGGAQMQLANPVNASSTCGAPVFTGAPGDTSLGMTGGTVPPRANNGTGANGTCFIQFDVTGPAASYTNTATATATAWLADGSNSETVNAQGSANVSFDSALTALKVFEPAAVSPGGFSTVTVRISNVGDSILTGVGAADTLPAGMVFANDPNAYATCAGNPSIVISGNTLTMDGAVLPAGSQCDLKFDVAVSGTGDWVNTIPAGGIIADGGVINQSPVSATLVQQGGADLTISEQINPSTIAFPGAPATLTITITNDGTGAIPVSALSLTNYFTSDGLPKTGANTYTDLFIADNPQTSTTCSGGLVSAVPGGKSVTLSGASMAPATSCEINVDVTVGIIGTSVNDIIPANAIATAQGMSNSVLASTSITTLNNLGVIKTFTPGVISAGSRSRLRVTVNNSVLTPVSDLSVLDTLPAGMTVAPGPNPFTTCTGGVITTPNPSEIQLDGGIVPAASGGVPGSCYMEIDVTVPTQGSYVNTISEGNVTGVSGAQPISNNRPAEDTLTALIPLDVQVANIDLTLDPVIQSGSGFNTGVGVTAEGASEVLTVRIVNQNDTALTGLTFDEPLPAGLFLTPTPNGATTCTGGTVTADPSGTFLRLTGANIAAQSSCEVTVNVLSNIPGSYVSTIPSGGVTTLEGIFNLEPTNAELVIATPPEVDLEFDMPVIPPSGTSTTIVTMGNGNDFPITLTAPLVVTLPSAPGPLVVAPAPAIASLCSGISAGSISAASGGNTITIPAGATLPAGGCSITVDVTGTTPGTYTGIIPAGDLQTDVGNNPLPANSPLEISAQPYIAGKVFADNDPTPDGIFTPGIDTPFAGVEIVLRSGADCTGPLLDTTLTNASGNYLFHPLTTGQDYSVCENGQPANTYNGIVTAGPLVPNAGVAGTASNPTTGPYPSVIEGIQLSTTVSGDNSGSPDNNFAEPYLSAISGKVFLDLNNNGLQNGGDTPLSGVEIQLHAAANCTSDPSPLSVLTGMDGSYLFHDLRNGTYTVCEPVQPAGTSNGITSAGPVPNGGAPGTVTTTTNVPSSIANIFLPPNTLSPDNNFAEILNNRRVSGQVFFDFNNNGLPDGSDYGIGSQQIQLSGTDVSGNPVAANTNTAPDGTFSFTDLPEGTYTLTQPNQPASTTNGITTAGSTGGTATATTVTPSVISGISLTGADLVSGDNLFAEIANPAPDLVVDISHTPLAFSENNDQGKYYVQISNIGQVDTSGTVTVATTLPAGVTPTAATGTGWTCSIAAQVVTCTSTDIVTASSGLGTPIVIDTQTGGGLNGQILTATSVVSGGSEPAAFAANNTDTDPLAVIQSASVEGSIWRDYNHDDVRDPGEPVAGGWTVELLLGGTVVNTAVTAPDGSYSITGIAPGSGYEIRFRDGPTGAIFGSPVPNETGAPFTNGVVNPATNPAGASNAQGTLSGLTLLAGTNTVQQSLPLDPNGVVHDSITRQPVAGATMTISGPAGFTAADVVGGSLSYTTGADGYYQFLLLNTAPPGLYQLSITGYPAGYMPLPSVIIPVCAADLTVTALPDPALVQTTNLAPTTTAQQDPATCATTSAGLAAGAGTTQYYDGFNLTVGTSAPVVNNHFPIDPILQGAFVATKTTPLSTVNIGALVPYTITIENTLAATMNSMAIIDRIPAGFAYKAGSATLDGVAVEPTISGRTLTWGGLSFAPSEVKTVRLMLVVGSGVGNGEYVNEAWSELQLIDAVLSNVASARVIVAPDPVFECTDILGKVFDDANGNGVQDAGEKGLAGVRLSTARGTLITTDEFGRYHVPCAEIPAPDRGSNFIMKLDESTLPLGYRLTTDNPSVERITQGKMSPVNFGAANYRLVRIELFENAFVDGTTAQAPQLQRAMQNLPLTLCEAPSSVLLVHVGRVPQAQARLDAVRNGLLRQWQQNGCGYPLSVYTKIIDAPLAVKGLK